MEEYQQHPQQIDIYFLDEGYDIVDDNIHMGSACRIHPYPFQTRALMNHRILWFHPRVNHIEIV